MGDWDIPQRFIFVSPDPAEAASFLLSRSQPHTEQYFVSLSPGTEQGLGAS